MSKSESKKFIKEIKTPSLPKTEKEALDQKWFKETSVPFKDTDGKLKNQWHKGSQYCFIEVERNV